MKFSACGIDDITRPHPDDGLTMRVMVFPNKKLWGKLWHVDIPFSSTWQEMIDKVFDGDLPEELYYVDEEEDMIQLGSEIEWDEAIKVARSGNFLPLVVRPETLRFNKLLDSYASDSDSPGGDLMEVPATPAKHTPDLRTNSADDKEKSVINTPDLRTNSADDKEKSVVNTPVEMVNSSAKNDGVSSFAAPFWFIEYMENFKQHMNAEILRIVNLHLVTNSSNSAFNLGVMSKPDLLPLYNSQPSPGDPHPKHRNSMKDDDYYYRQYASSKPEGTRSEYFKKPLASDLHSSHVPQSTDGNQFLVPKVPAHGTQGPQSKSTSRNMFLENLDTLQCRLPSTNRVPLTQMSSESVVHKGVFCHNCMSGIVGVRYKCGNCADFDLCGACEAADGSHCSDHVFIKIRKPIPSNQTEQIDGKPYPLLKGSIYSKLGKRGIQRKRSDKLKMWGSTLEALQKSLHQSASDELGAEIKNFSGKREPETGMIPRFETLKPVKSTMDAKFLFDETVPDGEKLFPGEVFTKSWRMVNFGSKPWDNETTLKFLWGTKGFTPTSMEVVVPHLMPRQNGSVSVHYKAPWRPGFYESHWSFTHKGHPFGHRIWCSIEVIAPKCDTSQGYVKSKSEAQSQEPENGESQDLNERGLSKDGIVQKDDTEQTTSAERLQNIEESETSVGASPPKFPALSDSELSDQSEIPDLVDENSQIVTDQDLSPPSSPELSYHSEILDLVDENGKIVINHDVSLPESPGQSDSELSDHSEVPDLVLNYPIPNAVQDADLGSVINLSSSSSESEFIVVPMPCCFDLPLSSCDSDTEEHSSPINTGEKKKSLSNSSSVIFLTPEGEEIAVKDLQFHNLEENSEFGVRKQAEIAPAMDHKMEKLNEKFRELEIQEGSGNEVKLVESSNKVADLRLFSKTHLHILKNKLKRSVETGEMPPILNPEVMDRDTEQLPCPVCGEKGDFPTPDDNKSRDSLASPAVSIFGSARSAISGLQLVTFPPDDNGDFIDPNLISPYYPMPLSFLRPKQFLLSSIHKDKHF